MTLLEWMLLAELILVICCAIFLLVGWSIARSTPNDPIYSLMRNFWRAMFVLRFRLRRYARMIESDEPSPAGAVPIDLADADLIEFFAGADALVDPTPRDKSAHESGQSIEDPRARWGTLQVIVTPRSSETRLASRNGRVLEMEVDTPDEAGAANRTVIEILSRVFEVKPFQITFVRGHFRRRKVVKITGLSQEEIDARLDAIEF